MTDKCPYCGKEYGHPQSLTDHVNANHWKKKKVLE